jgi:hypothetical protein
MCDAPEDCPNGPRPHEFVDPDDDYLGACLKQIWEDDVA